MQAVPQKRKELRPTPLPRAGSQQRPTLVAKTSECPRVGSPTRPPVGVKETWGGPAFP